MTLKQFALPVFAAGFLFSAAGTENLAAGKPAVFEQKPNYRLTTDANDPMDLTDGKIKNDDIWFYKGTVGWYGKMYYSLYFDLGSEKEIGTVRMHLADGHGGVHWPSKIFLLAGNSTDEFALIENMIETNKDILPPYEAGRRRVWIASKNSPVKARYVKFIVFPHEDTTYFFTDEIEILRGTEAARELGKTECFKGSTADFLKYIKMTDRVNQDAEQIKRNAQLAKVDFDVRELKQKLVSDYEKYLAYKKNDSDFPVNEAQAELAAANQKIMESAGLKGIVMWSSVRWDLFNSFSYPKDDAGCAEISMCPGEIRNIALNLTNAGKKKQTAKFRLSAPFPVTVCKAVSSADSNNFFNANRLEKQHALSGNVYQTELLPGESVQFFLKVKVPPNVKAGKYVLKAEQEKGPGKKFSIRVGRLKFPAELSSEYGTWDYLNAPRCHEQVVDRTNLAAALSLMKEYQVNLCWGHETAVPKANPSMFDENDKLIKPLDFKKFDEWLALMKGYRRYGLFGGGNIKSRLDFGFDPVKSKDRFTARLVSYLNALAAHVENDLKLDPGKFMLHFIDEASTDESKKVLSAWCGAVRKAASPSGKRFKSYGNPFIFEKGGFFNYSYPEIDFIQPNTGSYSREETLHFMKVNSLRGKEQEIGFYACANRVRQRDPYIYYGMAFRLGFLFDNYKGSAFWNLATGPRNVNELDYTGRYFSTWYFKGNEIFTSRQYEAVFEGREDYEYLLLLKTLNEILKGDTSGLANEGRKLAADIKAEILGELGWKDDVSLWETPKRRDIADLHRERILNFAEKVQKERPDVIAKTIWK